MSRYGTSTGDTPGDGVPEPQPTVPVPRNRAGRFRFENEDDRVRIDSPRSVADAVRRLLTLLFNAALGGGVAFYFLRAESGTAAGVFVAITTVFAAAAFLVFPRRSYTIAIDRDAMRVRAIRWTIAARHTTFAGVDVERFAFDERTNEIVIHTFDGKSRPLAPGMLGNGPADWNPAEMNDLEVPAEFTAQPFAGGVHPGPWLTAGLNRLATRFWGEPAERAARAGKSDV